MGERALEVLATGPLAVVEDLGRPGLAATGVGRAGAADRGALGLVNRLLANPAAAPASEVPCGGRAVGPRGRLTGALPGAGAPAEVDGRPVGHHSLVPLA